MADVFICYHMKSAGELARQVAANLEREGISCWYAERDLGIGAFAESIVKQIRNCKIFLLILNEESNHSLHIKNEIALVCRRINNDENVTLITFRVDGCKLSDAMRYYLSSFLTINAAPPTEERIQALTARIAETLNRKRPRNAKAAPQTVREIGMQ